MGYVFVAWRVEIYLDKSKKFIFPFRKFEICIGYGPFPGFQWPPGLWTIFCRESLYLNLYLPLESWVLPNERGRRWCWWMPSMVSWFASMGCKNKVRMVRSADWMLRKTTENCESNPKKTPEKKVRLVIASKWGVQRFLEGLAKIVAPEKNNSKEVFTWCLWTALAWQVWNVWSFLHSLKSCTVNKKVGWFGRFGALLLCPVLLKGSGQLFKNGGHPKANLSNVKFHCWKRRFLLETINFRFLRFLQPTFYLKFGVYWFLKVVIRHVIGGHVAAARLATGKIFKAEFLFLAALYNRDSQTPWVCKLPNISQLGLGMPRGLGYLHPPKINMTGWKIPAWMSRGSMYFLLKNGGRGILQVLLMLSWKTGVKFLLDFFLFLYGCFQK